MAQLSLDLDDEQLAALRGRVERRKLPVEKLIGDYLKHLAEGGEPVSGPPDTSPTSEEMVVLAERGGAFDWLADEPDLYSREDGEPV